MTSRRGFLVFDDQDRFASAAGVGGGGWDRLRCGAGLLVGGGQDDREGGPGAGCGGDLGVAAGLGDDAVDGGQAGASAFAFVLHMDSDHDDANLVQGAIDLGHNLGLTVVAEGVEGAAHVAALHQLGCDIAQGFHYARPMRPNDFTDWLRTHETTPSTVEISAVP
ncbi:EAL domain-containing protein [Actinoplanes sp. NPDC051470]|uniref:EAL domain-containing protein n=1 Tax=Actinoplanes sp. NPDC051470 TaxID=3157224 RepID=UPI00342C8EBF